MSEAIAADEMARLTALCEMATPGIWTAELAAIRLEDGRSRRCLARSIRPEDAEFAAAKNAIPGLMAMVEKLNADFAAVGEDLEAARVRESAALVREGKVKAHLDEAIAFGKFLRGITLDAVGIMEKHGIPSEGSAANVVLLSPMLDSGIRNLNADRDAALAEVARLRAALLDHDDLLREAFQDANPEAGRTMKDRPLADRAHAVLRKHHAATSEARAATRPTEQERAD